MTDLTRSDDIERELFPQILHRPEDVGGDEEAANWQRERIRRLSCINEKNPARGYGAGFWTSSKLWGSSCRPVAS